MASAKNEATKVWVWGVGVPSPPEEGSGGGTEGTMFPPQIFFLFLSSKWHVLVRSGS